MLKIWTIPNFITLLRFIGIPIFVWLLFGLENRLAAAILLGSIAATDWIDGFLARKLNQESAIGRIMDPTVDRILILVALFSLLKDESIPFAFGVISLAREVVIVLAVIVLASLKIDAIKVNWFGKKGTFFLFLSYPLFLLSESAVPSGVEQTSSIAAWVLGIPGLVLSYIALILYIPAVRLQIRKRKNTGQNTGQEK